MLSIKTYQLLLGAFHSSQNPHHYCLRVYIFACVIILLWFYLYVSHFPETLLFFYLDSLYLMFLTNFTSRFYYPLSLHLLNFAHLFKLQCQLSRFPLLGVDRQVIFELLLLLNSNFWIKKFGRPIRQLVYERFLLYCCWVVFSLFWM